MYIYIYIYVYMYLYMYMYIYIYIYLILLNTAREIDSSRFAEVRDLLYFPCSTRLQLEPTVLAWP